MRRPAACGTGATAGAGDMGARGRALPLTVAEPAAMRFGWHLRAASWGTWCSARMPPHAAPSSTSSRPSAVLDDRRLRVTAPASGSGELGCAAKSSWLVWQLAAARAPRPKSPACSCSVTAAAAAVLLVLTSPLLLLLLVGPKPASCAEVASCGWLTGWRMGAWNRNTTC